MDEPLMPKRMQKASRYCGAARNSRMRVGERGMHLGNRRRIAARLHSRPKGGEGFARSLAPVKSVYGDGRRDTG